MCVVLCLIVFGCQYQCNWLPGKTRLQDDLLCVEWDVKPYTLTHSLQPGIELPGITRTRPDTTLEYGLIRIFGICLDFCDSQLGYTSRRETQSGHLSCGRFWCTTLWRHAWLIIAHLVICGAGQITNMGQFNQLSDMAHNDVCIDKWSDYAKRYVASLAASTNVAFLKQNLDICWLSWTVCPCIVCFWISQLSHF